MPVIVFPDLVIEICFLSSAASRFVGNAVQTLSHYHQRQKHPWFTVTFKKSEPNYAVEHRHSVDFFPILVFCQTHHYTHHDNHQIFEHGTTRGSGINHGRDVGEVLSLLVRSRVSTMGD